MKIALALGGGAALGFAHIGVLHVLAENGVDVGAVAGTSIGAIAAAALASGRLETFEAIARGAHIGRVLTFLDPLFGRGAVLGGRRIRRVLDQEFGARLIEDLPIPTALVAADLLTGDEVRLTAGALVPAIRASIAIPSLFAPVRIGDRLLIDGGMVANLPVGAARELLPCVPVIAIDLMGDFLGHVGEALPGGLGGRPSSFRIGRAAFLMIMAQMAQQIVAIERPEIVIRPRIGHIGTGAFTRASALIRLGREAAEEALPRIRAVL